MKVLGIVSEVNLGTKHAHFPCLSFKIRTLEGTYLKIFDLNYASKMIKKAKIYDIKNLEGRACIVEITEGILQFLDWF